MRLLWALLFTAVVLIKNIDGQGYYPPAPYGGYGGKLQFIIDIEYIANCSILEYHQATETMATSPMATEAMATDHTATNPMATEAMAINHMATNPMATEATATNPMATEATNHTNPQAMAMVTRTMASEIITVD